MNLICSLTGLDAPCKVWSRSFTAQDSGGGRGGGKVLKRKLVMHLASPHQLRATPPPRRLCLGSCGSFRSWPHLMRKRETPLGEVLSSLP